MGAVSLAQRGGVLGSGIYATQKPNVDIAGAIGAVSQALTAQREGAIQRAYLQNQMARQRLLDERALQQQLYEREFQGKQLAQQHELALGQHDIESQRIAAEQETKRQQLQIMQAIAQLKADTSKEVAKMGIESSRERGADAAAARGPTAANSPQAQAAKSMAGAQKAYQAYIKQFMAPQTGPGGIKTSGMSFQAASQAAREAVRETYPDEATKLWGAEAAPGSGSETGPTNITQGEMSANAAYTQRYRTLDPKDPQYGQKKADLDKALQAQLTQVHSQTPQPLPQPTAQPTGPGIPGAGPMQVAPTGPGPTGAPSTLPSGDPSDNDQEP